METTLVLDVGYQPITCTTWRCAIVWVFDRVVEVVDEYPDRFIRTPNWQVNMPSVVRFLKPIPRRRALKFSRHNVYSRDRARCQYCGARVARDGMTYDHVVPRAQGGRTTWENVVVACMRCNQKKGGRTPAQAGMVLAAPPVKPKRLVEAATFTLRYRDGMPEPWRDYLRTAVYWDGELEHDGE